MSAGAHNDTDPTSAPSQAQLPDMWLPHVVAMLEELDQSGHLAAGGAALLQPRLRPVFSRLCPAVVAAYTVLAAAGSATCVAAARALYRGGAPPASHCGPLLTLLAACLANCLLVLPLTLTVLLLQNWVLGSTMCYMLPIMQNIPLTLMTLTLLLMTVRQYCRLLRRRRSPASSPICLLAVWLVSICAALPYLIYTDYLDMELFFGDILHGVGLCMVNVGQGVGPLTKILFVTTYILPLLVMGLLQLFISQGLAEQRSSQQLQGEDDTQHAAPCTVHRCSYVTDASRETDHEADTLGETRAGVLLDLAAEAAAHKYTLAMTLSYAACLCPLMVLRVAKQAISETYNNAHYFDIIYVVFVWICFLTSCTTPALLLAWHKQSGGPKRTVRTPSRQDSRGDGHHPSLLPAPRREHHRKYSATAVSMQLLQLVVPTGDSGYRLTSDD